MTTLTNLQDDLQARMADKSGRFLVDADCTRYLNIAYHEFVNKTEMLLREWKVCSSGLTHLLKSQKLKSQKHQIFQQNVK
jgi:hypothetical protein